MQNRVPKISRTAVLVLLVFGFCAPASAVLVKDLYAASVEVADRSPATERAAKRSALQQVLVKVSGTETSLELDPVVEALKRPRNFVRQFYYRYREKGSGQLLLHVEFYPQRINQLVTGAGAPLWTANRPRTLIWLVLDDGGERSFVSGELDPERVADIEAVFKRRGLPMRLPLLDLTDALSLSPSQVWNLDSYALRAASARYGKLPILAGRFTRLSGDRWFGNWLYLQGQNQIRREVDASEVQSMYRSGADLVAEVLSTRYAVEAGAQLSGNVVIAVSGVDNFEDYAHLIAALERIELVNGANVSRIAGDTLTVHLEAQADAVQLDSILQLNPRLQVSAEPTEQGVPLYQWIK